MTNINNEIRNNKRLLNHLKYILDKIQYDSPKYRTCFYLGKIIFFSELQHLQKYDRLIISSYDTENTGWQYINRKLGAFPLKLNILLNNSEEFYKEGNEYRSIIKYNRDYLSLSEIKAVDVVCSRIQNYSIKELINRSYFDKVNISTIISYADFIDSMPNK